MNCDAVIPEMIPIKEVCQRTGLSYNYLRTACLQGKIAHIRAGSKYLINFDRLIDYLNTSHGGDNDEHPNDS